MPRSPRQATRFTVAVLAAILSGSAFAIAFQAAPALAADTASVNGSAAFQINPAAPNTVTVVNPFPQSSTVGMPVSLQISASDFNTGQTLTYAAIDLPAGLSINATTGLISGAPTTAGTSSVTVTATDGTGAIGSATFNWTVTGGGGCKVVYTTNSQWPGGFTAQVVITNTGTSAISGWNLVFAFSGDQKITSNFNGTFSQSGETATLTNASYNGAIAVNGSVTVGFQGTWTNSDAAPTSFALNGATCG